MKYIKTNFVYQPCASLSEHVHEIQGTLEMTNNHEEQHTHNFAMITDEGIPIGSNDHIHEVRFQTNAFHHHTHEFIGRTSGAIPVGERHVHFLESETGFQEGHNHRFNFVTFLDNFKDKK